MSDLAGALCSLCSPHQVTLQLRLNIQLKSLVPSEQITSALHLLAATGPYWPACQLPSAGVDAGGGGCIIILALWF